MSQTTSTASAVLKEFYLPAVRQVMNSEVFLLSQLEMNSEDIEGKRAVLSINTGRNHGVGARAELGTLPTAGRQGYSEERVPLKYNYGSIKVSGPLMRAMGSDRGSFTRPLESETSGVIRDLKNDVNRQCYGNGTGAIAACASASGQVITLAATTSTTALRQLEEGMVIDVGTVANPTLRGTALVISSVNVSAKTVTVTGTIAGTTTTTDFIFRQGSGGADGGLGQKELTGLSAIVASSGALFNIDPSTVSRWASYVDSNSGTNRAVAETMFTKASMEVNIRSGEQINLWVTTDGVHRGVANLLTSLKQFPSTNQLKSGYTGLDMGSVAQGQGGSNEVTLTYDKDCPGNTAFGLTTKRLQQYRMSDWEFMEEDGSVLSRVSGQDAYEATLFCYHEIATDARNAHARISDLTES
jgi:hypothetical protein